MKKDLFLEEMGKRIVSRRKSLRLSQEELATLANVTPQLISTAERGEKALRPENLLKISKALGISTDYILTGLPSNWDNSFLAQKLSCVSGKYLNLIESIIDHCLSFDDDTG